MLAPRSVETFRYRLTPPSQREPISAWAEWITRLRWLAIAAQCSVIGFSVSVLAEPAVTLSAFGLVIGVLVFANIDTRRRLDSGVPIEPLELPVQLALDVLALTAMLLLAGGPANPFAVLLLLHVVMAVMMLPRVHAAALVGLILLCYGLLFTGSLPLDLQAHAISAPTLAVLGELVAFAVTAVTLGGFLRGMVGTIRAQALHDDQQLVRSPDEHGRIAS